MQSKDETPHCGTGMCSMPGLNSYASLHHLTVPLSPHDSPFLHTICLCTPGHLGAPPVALSSITVSLHLIHRRTGGCAPLHRRCIRCNPNGEEESVMHLRCKETVWPRVHTILNFVFCILYFVFCILYFVFCILY